MPPSDNQTWQYVKWGGHWYGVPAEWVANLERAGFIVVQASAKAGPADEAGAHDNTKQ